ncbi:hypothetical protein P8A18_00505 [Streptomyces castrisilvae]|uniref:Uncharacterized protein n=1 Tax=Streptomyces castrisilvae TaxID=3033811 RepID=A0ABY9HBX7_9ACTN|nr:hypothetical protein [Streptomyces sp. Mut1]WLQ32010.1 hypothetical protein P8A18_00505 [Streptomyces sp. Mut1]
MSLHFEVVFNRFLRGDTPGPVLKAGLGGCFREEYGTGPTFLTFQDGTYGPYEPAADGLRR